MLVAAVGSSLLAVFVLHRDLTRNSVWCNKRAARAALVRWCRAVQGVKEVFLGLECRVEVVSLKISYAEPERGLRMMRHLG
jgi:hypothetical protein